MTPDGSPDASAWWQQSLPELLKDLRASGTGLIHGEVRARLKRYGRNEFRDRPERALWVEFLRRFRNPLVLILIAASVVSALTGEVASFLIIVVMVLMSVTSTSFRNTAPDAPQSGCAKRCRSAPPCCATASSRTSR